MTLPGNNPLAYEGVRAPNPPNVIIATRAPTTADVGYDVGTIWIDTSAKISYELVNNSGGVATWNVTSVTTSLVLPVQYGGTGDSTLTAHGVLIGEGTNPVNVTAAGTTGTVLIGNTGSDPTFSATPSVTTLTATTVHATTIDTNVAAAELSLSGTTIAATGSNANVDLDITTKGTGSIIFSQSKAGVDQNMQITNSDNTAAAGNAGLQLAVGGSTSTGDPYVSFQISGVGASTMTMGLDNSASDTFVISNSSTLGTSNALTLTQAGALGATTSVTAGTTLTATLGDITATNGNFVSSAAGKGLSFNANTATGAAASPVVLNSRAGQVVFTSVSIAAAADLTLTITNSEITGSSTQVIYSMSGSTTGSAPSIKSVTNSAGSSAIVVTNGTGASTTTADITLTFLVIN